MQNDSRSYDKDREAAFEIRRCLYSQADFDSEFGIVPRKGHSLSSYYKDRFSKKRICSAEWWKGSVLGFFPILFWLPQYNIKKDLVHDMVAGLTVGVMHIPQGMAYAGLAGLEPVYGLYMGFFPSLFYMIFGTSRHVSHGVFAVLSLMTGSVRYRLFPEEESLSDKDIQGFLLNDTLESPVVERDCVLQPVVLDPSFDVIHVITALTLAVGIFQVLMGVLHLGFLSAYLSDQVVSGFTTGAAVHVFTAQINKILGVKLPRYNQLGKQFFIWRDLIGAVRGTNVATVITSMVCIVVLVLFKELINPRVKRKFKIPIPIDLILIIVVTSVSHFAGFKSVYGMKVVDRIPTGLPSPSVPPVEVFQYIWGDAISIAIVGVAINLSLAKIFAKKYGYRIESNQETLASGLAQIFSSFFLCHPESASLARSALVEEIGQRSQLATVFSCGLLFIVLQWLGPLFQALPMCVLASIIVVALKGMFLQFKELRTLWPVSKLDFSIWVGTFLATVCLDVKEGLAVGVVMALLTVIFRSQWPQRTLIRSIEGTELYKCESRYKNSVDIMGVKLFRFDSPLIFSNAELFRESLYESCEINLAKAKQWVLEQEELSKGQRGKVTSDADFEIKVEDGAEESLMTKKQRPFQHPPECPDFVILDCSGFNFLDSQGMNSLKEVYEELEDIGVILLFAACGTAVRDMMDATRFVNRVPSCRFYVTLHDAVLATRNWKESEIYEIIGYDRL